MCIIRNCCSSGTMMIWKGTVNPAMATGEIEVLGKELEILNIAATPPFQLDEYTAVGEEVRLHYRYMDLRRHEMQERLVLRSKITAAVRSFMDAEGFLDIETPILTRATPDNPVILTHASGHLCLANGRAMQLAGVTRRSRSPAGGKILHDEHGEPIGVFREAAMDPIYRAQGRSEGARTAKALTFKPMLPLELLRIDILKIQESKND